MCSTCAPTVVGVLADAEQLAITDRMQIAGIPRNLEFSSCVGLSRVGQVDDVERVGFSEGDDIREVTDVANGVNAFRQTKATDFPKHVVGVVVPCCEDGDGRFADSVDGASGGDA